MADITKPQSQVLEEEDLISSQQTLDHNPPIPPPNSSNSFEDDDDLVDEYVPYTFNLDPFSPLNSSFFLPSSSSPYNSSQSDSTTYPDCLNAHDYDHHEYDQMDFITDLFDSRQQTEINDHDRDADSLSNNIEELNLGLRVTGIESESDTEELGQVNNQNDDNIQTRVSNFEHLQDCPSFDNTEEISASSEISSEGDAAVSVLEWEILLAVNTLEQDLDLENNGENGFVYTPEFDTLIGQFVETVRALRGSPPAAKSVVDNLPLVALNKGLKGDENVICAVCKDEILSEEKVAELPCRHYYHGDCIKPWLSIRNTCPVCRFELPTDDVDYERSKNRVDDDELRVGYDFQLSP